MKKLLFKSMKIPGFVGTKFRRIIFVEKKLGYLGYGRSWRPDLHALLRVFKSSFSSNRFQMLPPILSRSPRKRGKYVENFGKGEHVSRELRRRGRRIMQRKQRDLIHAFPRGRSQVLQSFCDHVPRAVQMFDRPQLRALNFSLLFHFCSHWCYYNGITV